MPLPSRTPGLHFNRTVPICPCATYVFLRVPRTHHLLTRSSDFSLVNKVLVLMSKCLRPSLNRSDLVHHLKRIWIAVPQRTSAKCTCQSSADNSLHHQQW
ncbi:hypothetical protein NPIL_65841 [Nephila pilipes]|uniref:Uncharacterized protein n=1 Tax=Nephila pilipes TaxID=299642 RepID=A0A8X6N752_NEPPI|nr:hypothetical protein NPIL_65841 [Nephila pilipes]